MSNTGPFIVWLLIVAIMLVGIFWGAREFGGVGGRTASGVRVL